MIKQYSKYLLITCILLSQSLMAKDNLQDLPGATSFTEKLILQKLKTNKQISVEAGQRITIWTETLGVVDGIFSGRHGDTLLVLDGTIEVEVTAQQIRKLRMLSDQPWRIVGGGVKLTGIGGMVFGGISLVAGTIALFEDNLGAVVLVAVPFLGGGGYLGYWLGKRIQGRTVHMDDGWVIVID